MPKPAIRTERTDCGTCEANGIEARLIRPRGLPPLDYWPHPSGTIAARHEASGAWTARRLEQGEAPIPPEKRYLIHQCQGGAQ